MQTSNLIKVLVEDSKPVKPLLNHWLRLFVWLCLTFVWNSGIVSLIGVRPDILLKLQYIPYVAELILSFLIAITAAAAAIWLSIPDMGKQVRFIPFLPLIFFAGLAIGMWANTPFHYSGLVSAATGLPSGRVIAMCTIEMIAISIVPLLFLLYLVRRGATIHGLWAGAMVALAAGSSAYLCERLIEAKDCIFHLMIWHIVPIFIISLVGILLGKYILRW